MKIFSKYIRGSVALMIDETLLFRNLVSEGKEKQEKRGKLCLITKLKKISQVIEH
jgi:hypothetical protein